MKKTKKITALLFTAALITVVSVSPAFAKEHSHYYDYEDEEEEEDRWAYDFDGSIDKDISRAIDEYETSLIDKTGNTSYSRGYSKDRYDGWEDTTGPGFENEKTETSVSFPAVYSTGWNRDSLGWFFINPDSSYPVNEWMLINEEYYYFDENGYMVTGWYSVDGCWYYFDDVNGNMLKDTVTPDGFFVDEKGVWIKGMAAVDKK